MNIYKALLLTCIIVLGSVSCGSKNKERSGFDLFPFPPISFNRHPEVVSPTPPKYKDKDGRPVSGYIDRNGQLVINLEFDYGDVFSNGLARVITNKKFGYINTNGEFVIKPQFDHAENFGFEDAPLALVKVGNKYGYIDKTGNYAISPQFEDAGSFTSFFTEVSEKSSLTLARVKVGNRWGFIDKSGNHVIPSQFSWVGSFSEGRAVAQVGDKCGYINAAGQMVIEPQFYCAVEYGVSFKGPGDFSSGLARVGVEDNPPLSPTPTPTRTLPRSSGDDIVYPGSVERKFKYGFIDRRGKFVIEPQFEAAKDFSGGFAAVGFTKSLTVLRLQDRGGGGTMPIEMPQHITKWGFINETGLVVINPSFDNVGNFTYVSSSVESGIRNEWLAEVEIDSFGGSCGYIDKTGKYVINPQFPASSGDPFLSGCSSFFASGVAYVGTFYSGWSVIDNKGKIISTYRR
jgi:WG containing repeat